LIIIVPPDTAMEPYHTAIATSGIAMDELPEIQIINERLSGPQLRDLHRGGACYVSAARGEAWGLGAFEAAVMGRPIVAAVVGGMDEYLEGLHIGGEYSRLYSVSAQRAPCFADAHDVSIETDAQGRRVLTAKAALPAGVDCGQTWADPDLCELADAMRLAMNDVVADGWPDTEFDRSALEKKFSYAAVGPQLYRTLQRIIDDQN
jgi:glycosyltransferase involved in cell wall biosynthesis